MRTKTDFKDRLAIGTIIAILCIEILERIVTYIVTHPRVQQSKPVAFASNWLKSKFAKQRKAFKKLTSPPLSPSAAKGLPSLNVNGIYSTTMQPPRSVTARSAQTHPSNTTKVKVTIHSSKNLSHSYVKKVLNNDKPELGFEFAKIDIVVSNRTSK